jgi:predicted aspartyl protease
MIASASFQKLLLLLLLSLLNASLSSAFLTSPHRPNLLHSGRLYASEDFVKDDTLLDELRAMRVKELKAELSALQVSTQDAFEKEQLIQRLYESRKRGDKAKQTSSQAVAQTSGTVIRAPLFFTSMDQDLRIAAVNMNGGITVNPSDQPYATIQIQVELSGKTFPLTLLLDTACSGFVLRPSVVDKYNLPKLQTPVTMTGAGGTVGATGLTQLERFRLGETSFGPLPAAVQDIGALPSSLDGIIGLSFLSQFSVVEMDFIKGELVLYKRGEPAPVVDDSRVVAKGDMSLLPLGIYVVDVFFGSRGPVKMLVDSGASCTFLNWKGVSDLGIDRKNKNNSFLEQLSSPMGAMGSDNVAMQLTHRINVSSALRLGRGELPGLSLKDSKRLSVDIGDIAILDQMRSQGVGGILGIDALMRCKGVRMSFQGPRKEIWLQD